MYNNFENIDIMCKYWEWILSKYVDLQRYNI